MIDGWRPHDLAKFPLCRRTKVHIKLARLFFVQKLRTLQTSYLNVSFPRSIVCKKINPNKTNQRTVFWHLEYFLCTDKICRWLIFCNGFQLKNLLLQHCKPIQWNLHLFQIIRKFVELSVEILWYQIVENYVKGNYELWTNSSNLVHCVSRYAPHGFSLSNATHLPTTIDTITMRFEKLQLQKYIVWNYKKMFLSISKALNISGVSKLYRVRYAEE